MTNGPNSASSARERNPMAIFDAEYATWGLSQVASATGAGATVRMCGFGDLARWGAHARETMNAPLRLTRIMTSYRLTSVSATVTGQCVEALLTRTSMPPKRATALAIAFWTCCSSVMSVLIASAAPPAATHAASASWIVPGSAGLLVVVCARMTTFAPRPAQRTAMASPIPRDAPVTTTVRPRMLNATSGETAPSTARTSWSSAETRFARYARRLSKKGVAVFRSTSATSSFSTGAAPLTPALPLYSSRLSSADAAIESGGRGGGERRVQSGDEESGESDVTRSPDTRPSLSSVETSEAFFLGGPLPDRSIDSAPGCAGGQNERSAIHEGLFRASLRPRAHRPRAGFATRVLVPARPPRRVARRDVGPGVHEQDDRG